MKLVATTAVAVAFVLQCAFAAGSSAIRGEVVDPFGNPVPNAKLSVKTLSGAVESETSVDSLGRYRIGDLSPGPKSIVVTAPGFRTEGVNVVLNSDRLYEATLGVDEAMKVDIGLTVVDLTDPQERILSVHVVDSDGRDIPRAEVYLRSPVNPRFVRHVTTDRKGRYRFAMRNAGQFEVHARARDGRSGTLLFKIGVGPSPMDVEVVLRTFDF